jgi:hypothetical protein
LWGVEGGEKGEMRKENRVGERGGGERKVGGVFLR